MASRLLPGGLRAQLALAIALVTAVALGLSFVAVYRGTGARLRDRIDEDLTTQVDDWDRLRAAAQLSAPDDVVRFAQQFIDDQSYHPAARVFVVALAGAEPVTNQPRILYEESREREEHGDEHEEHPEGLQDAPIGLSDVSVEEAGRMRVLSRPIFSAGRRIGTIHVADPLTPVTDAQASLLRTFALVGSLALALAVAAGVLIATLIARPLQRMAAVATAVDSGDLTLRAGAVGARGEVGVLATAFDHMLERLERAFARQRDFVSDASHELRTPLAVLRAQVELLDRAADGRERKEDARLILRRLDEIDRLVEDMLTLASAEAGRLVQPHPIDLHDFFEDVRRDLPLFGEREFHVEPVDGVLEADPDRLTQVLRNLVRNAVAHTGPGGRVAVVATVRHSWLQIAVSDDGPGIPPEHLERVFERFHRVDESRARERGGTGLGLAIARAIVEAHGGRIRAESRAGAGTTITLELPRYRPPATEPT
jgi:signal transduction histidine kinase